MNYLKSLRIAEAEELAARQHLFQVEDDPISTYIEFVDADLEHEKCSQKMERAFDRCRKHEVIFA